MKPHAMRGVPVSLQLWICKQNVAGFFVKYRGIEKNLPIAIILHSPESCVFDRRVAWTVTRTVTGLPFDRALLFDNRVDPLGTLYHELDAESVQCRHNPAFSFSMVFFIIFHLQA